MLSTPSQTIRVPSHVERVDPGAGGECFTEGKRVPRSRGVPQLLLWSASSRRSGRSQTRRRGPGQREKEERERRLAVFAIRIGDSG